MSVLSLQQADVFRLLQSDNTKWLIRAINLLLVVWIASLLASLTWGLVTPQGNSQLENIEVTPASVVVDPNAQLIRQLPGWHLMGVASSKQAPVVTSTPVDAPDTRLKLVLHGVFASEESGKARAINADPRGKEEHYAIGDSLPGNAELSEVYPDRVILQRNGRYETLRLPTDNKPGNTASSRNTSPSRPAARRSSSSPAQRLKAVRQNLKKRPRDLSNLVRATPKRDGKGRTIGYELGPGRDPALFAQVGLQKGDVAIEINDIKLDNPANSARALKSAQSGETVSITVLRNGQEEVLSLSVPE